MPRVQCPGCGKEHELAVPFREPKKFCLRCNEAFVVSPENLHYSSSELAERARPGAKTRVLKENSGFDENETSDENDTSDIGIQPEPDHEIEPASRLRTSARKRKKQASKEFDEDHNGHGKDHSSPYEDLAEEDESDPRAARENKAHSLPKIVWVLLAGGLAAVGVAVYFFVIAPPNQQPKMKVAALPSQPVTAPTPPDSKDKDKSLHEAAKSEDSPILPEASSSSPPAKTETLKPEAPAIKISAARLADEWTMDADLAKKKYESKLLQVTGLFDRWVDAKSPRGLFAVEGPAICFVLPKLVAARKARAELLQGRPITVKGRFSTTPPPPFPPSPIDGEGRPSGTPQSADSPAAQEGTLTSPPAGEGKTKEAPSSPIAGEDKGAGKPTSPGPPAAGGKSRTIGGGGDFFLQDAEILPLSPPADALYLGKEMELSGHVIAVIPASENSEYPTLKLERETNCRVDNDCLFPKSDEAEVKKLTPGSFVTLSCTCSGRSLRRKDDYSVRFDNCHIIYTTAPASSQIARLPVIHVLRDYEEDLRTALPPAFDSDPNAKTMTAAQLAKEFKQDSKTFEKGYRNKILVVTGKLYRKGDRNVILETGQTDNPLRIQCFFTRQSFLKLENNPDHTIRGLCSGLTGGQTLRLDNCESLDTVAKVDQPRLTVDYLPSKPGQVLVYDLATHPMESKGAALAFRKVFTWTEGGIVERAITHAGRLPKGKNLTDPEVFKDWITLKTTKKYSQSEPPSRLRVFGGFIEIGQEFTSQEGQKSVSWEPVIKLGLKKGESWEWSRGSERHQCKVIDIELPDAGGRGAATRRSTATIREAITDLKRPDLYAEIRHVFVRNVGEVEREETARLPSGQMKVISLMRLAEDGNARAQEDRPLQPPMQKAPVGKFAIDPKDSKSANKDK
jgi:tRNA_anti-like